MRALTLAVIALPVAAGLLVGCGSSADAPVSGQATVASPAAYVTAVQEALKPPGRLASLVSEGARRGEYTTSRADLDRVVGEAQSDLDALRALQLDSPALVEQRNAFVAAYARVVADMRVVADAVDRGEPAGVARAAKPFFTGLRGLSSAVSP